MDTNPVVCMVRDEPTDKDKIYGMVKRAVDQLGGIGKFVKPGEKVLVYCSLAFPYPPPLITDPRVTRAVAKLVLDEAKPKSVTVSAEASMMTHLYRKITTRESFFNSGTAAAVEEVGAKWIPEDEYPYDEVQTGGLIARKVRISRLLKDNDVMICVPTGGRAGRWEIVITAGTKLPAQGMLDDEYKVMWHNTSLSQKMCDVYKYIHNTGKYRLVISDNILGMTAQDPAGEPYVYNLIMAGSDPVAVDTISCMIQGIDPLRSVEGHLRLCDFYGVGCADYSKIKTVGNTNVDEMQKIHGRPRPAMTFIDGVFPGVEVMDAGTCAMCYAWCRPWLDWLHVEGLRDQIVEKYGGMTVVLGVNPDVPEEPQDVRGLITVYGDCAIRHCFAHKASWMWALETKGSHPAGQNTALEKAGKKIFVVPGCPPVNSVSKFREWAVKENIYAQKKPGVAGSIALAESGDP